MFPRPGSPARWHALKLQALADGLLDAAILRRGEEGRPQEEARDKVISRQKAAVERSLDLLEAEPPPRHLDIGTLTVGCALGYLDLRFAAEAWRGGRPRLTAWFEEMAAEAPLARTVPKDP